MHAKIMSFMTLLIYISLSACSNSAREEEELVSVKILEPTLIEGARSASDEIHYFFRPTDIGIDNDSNLHVLDIGTGSIYVIDMEGTLIDTYAGKGSGPGEIGATVSTGIAYKMTIKGKYTVVYDGSLGRISVFEDREYRTSFRAILPPSDIQIINDDSVALSMLAGDTLIHVYSFDGLLISSFGEPLIDGSQDASRFSQNRLVVLDNAVAVLPLTWPEIILYSSEALDRIVSFSWIDVTKEATDLYQDHASRVMSMVSARPRNAMRKDFLGIEAETSRLPLSTLVSYAANEEMIIGLIGNRLFEISPYSGTARRRFDVHFTGELEDIEAVATSIAISDGVLAMALPNWAIVAVVELP